MHARVLIPESAESSKNWQSIIQCHQDAARTPPLSLSLIAPDSIALVERSDKDAYRIVYKGPAPRGRWFDLKLSFRSGEGGFAKLWLDERLVADEPGVFAWAGPRKECTLKFGIYRGAAPTPFEIRFDDVDVAVQPGASDSR